VAASGRWTLTGAAFLILFLMIGTAMRHTKTPSDTGWYWVSSAPDELDGWQMVYWDSENEKPRLYAFSPEVLFISGLEDSRGLSVWEQVGDHWEDSEGSVSCRASWCGPDVWVGPLSQPGGPFGGPIAEFDQETFQEAKKLGHVMVMRHIDYTVSDRRMGTVTQISVMPADEH
jgi:hypothetical protein